MALGVNPVQHPHPPSQVRASDETELRMPRVTTPEVPPHYLYSGEARECWAGIASDPEYSAFLAGHPITEIAAQLSKLIDLDQASVVFLGVGTSTFERAVAHELRRYGDLAGITVHEQLDTHAKAEAAKFESEFPGLDVSSISGNLSALDLELSVDRTRPVAAFLVGFTISNLPESESIIRRVASQLRPDDVFVVDIVWADRSIDHRLSQTTSDEGPAEEIFAPRELAWFRAALVSYFADRGITDDARTQPLRYSVKHSEVGYVIEVRTTSTSFPDGLTVMNFVRYDEEQFERTLAEHGLATVMTADLDGFCVAKVTQRR